jgi:hypothetical protein
VTLFASALVTLFASALMTFLRKITCKCSCGVNQWRHRL